jgi:hypothetical protein
MMGCAKNSGQLVCLNHVQPDLGGPQSLEAQVEAASRSAAHLAKSTGQYVLEKAAAI